MYYLLGEEKYAWCGAPTFGLEAGVWGVWMNPGSFPTKITGWLWNGIPSLGERNRDLTAHLATASLLSTYYQECLGKL
jgi:hypothetical protein